MHEMSLMGDILQLVHEDAGLKGIKKIEKIELLVGEVSNAMPEALQMAFDIFRDQNLHLFSEKAQLMIQIEEARAKCILCGLEYKPNQKIALCPSCKVPSGKLLGGESFQVLSYEGSKEDESKLKNGCIDE